MGDVKPLRRALAALVTWLVAYVAASSFVNALFTGATGKDILVQTVLPIIMAIAIVTIGMFYFIRNGL